VKEVSGIIRKALETDFREIVQILKLNNLPTAGIQQHIHQFLVREIKSNNSTQSYIEGCVGLELYGKNALLRSLAVHPQYQNQGIGSKLLYSIIQNAKLMEIKDLFLFTTTAEGYFKKHNFSSVSRDDVPIDIKESLEISNACPSTAICMNRKLSI
jgi:amino-acid N-acetyltransferase